MLIVLGILYYMCTGLAPDRLYKRDASEIEYAIPNRYSKDLSRLIYHCCRQRYLRPDAYMVYNIAKKHCPQSLPFETMGYSLPQPPYIVTCDSVLGYYQGLPRI